MLDTTGSPASRFPVTEDQAFSADPALLSERVLLSLWPPSGDAYATISVPARVLRSLAAISSKAAWKSFMDWLESCEERTSEELMV